MPLHQFQSRKKRLENALTVLALGSVLTAMAVFMSFDGERFQWENLVPYAVAIPVGLIALVFYVRGREAK